MWKVPPRKRGTNQSSTDKIGSYRFKKSRMPQMQYFKSTGNKKYPVQYLLAKFSATHYLQRPQDMVSTFLYKS
jgi:hypothetical protein